MSAKTKLRSLSLICLYPIVSTFLMTLIWQITQRYIDPFLGGYYFKWVFLYAENNPHWLSPDYIATTRVLYSIYIAAYVLLFLFSVLALFRRRGKAVFAWGICVLWLGDCGWIVADMVMSAVKWQSWILLGEHLIFIVWTILLSIWYLELKKTHPDLFRKKRTPRTVYRNRF